MQNEYFFSPLKWQEITAADKYMYIKSCQILMSIFIFFQPGTVMNPTIWLVLSAVQIFLSLTTVTVTLARVFFLWVFFRLRLDNAALGLQPWAAFSRPRSQFFTIWTFQLANNIYNSLAPTNIYNMYFLSRLDRYYEAEGP